MLHTREHQPFPRFWFIAQPPRVLSPAESRGGLHWRNVVWALLAAGMVFCHGCHGDEDNELSALLPRTKETSQESGRAQFQGAMSQPESSVPGGDTPRADGED